MSSSDLFLLSFSALFAIGSIVVYNIDFTKWENHSHE